MSDETLALNASGGQNKRSETRRTKREGFDAMREKSALAADLTLPVLEVHSDPELIVLRLHGERPFSWNMYATSINPMARRNEYNRVKSLVQMRLFEEGYSRRPLEKRVGIEFHAYMLSPAYDPDNPAGKPYIDALQSFIIKKDDLRFVRMVVPFVSVVKTAPRVELRISPSFPWLDHFPEN